MATRRRRKTDWAFDYLPKVDREYSWTHIWDDMYHGKVKGLIAFGMNGVAIGPNSQKNIDALKKADLLVVCDIYPEETSDFWRSPGITPDEMKNIKTEVYRLPGAGFAEKDGTFVNSARWLQWKWAAVPPPGDAKLDQEILARIFLKVRELYQKEGGKFPDPILNLAWNYTDPEQSIAFRSRQGAEWTRDGGRRRQATQTDHQSRPAVAGLRVPARRRLDIVRQLDLVRFVDRSWRADAAARHRRSVGSGHLSQLGMVVADEPARAVQPRLVRRDGKPWDPDRRQVWWNEAAETMGRQRCPRLQGRFAAEGSHGSVHHESGGRGAHLRARWPALADGPFPEFYEPIESPIANPLHPQQSNNPVVKKYTTDMDKYGTPEEGFNIVCTTYRLTEHYHYWTKNNPMNVQLVPEPFVEIPVELGGRTGHQGGEQGKGIQRAGQLRGQGDGHAAHPADDDRRQEDLSDRHPDSLRLSRHSGGRGQDVARS